nr:zinc finger, CCHC-type [Tanacetum cinerariifolium]
LDGLKQGRLLGLSIGADSIWDECVGVAVSNPSNELAEPYGYEIVGTEHFILLICYLDASWINHVENSSSTSGWVFLLGGGVISWASKKQTCITSSTIESEFVALADAGK